MPLYQRGPDWAELPTPYQLFKSSRADNSTEQGVFFPSHCCKYCPYCDITILNRLTPVFFFLKQRLTLSSLLTDNLPCHFVSAFGAGFVTTVIASPVDVVKTRYMNSPPGQYTSAINCAWTMLTKEGPTAFYKGWAFPLRPHHHCWKDSRFSFFMSSLTSSLTFFFPLQICALISTVGIMECCHVCLIWANQEGHDGHKEEDRVDKLKPV